MAHGADAVIAGAWFTPRSSQHPGANDGEECLAIGSDRGVPVSLVHVKGPAARMDAKDAGVCCHTHQQLSDPGLTEDQLQPQHLGTAHGMEQQEEEDVKSSPVIEHQDQGTDKAEGQKGEHWEPGEHVSYATTGHAAEAAAELGLLGHGTETLPATPDVPAGAYADNVNEEGAPAPQQLGNATGAEAAMHHSQELWANDEPDGASHFDVAGDQDPTPVQYTAQPARSRPHGFPVPPEWGSHDQPPPQSAPPASSSEPGARMMQLDQVDDTQHAGPEQEVAHDHVGTQGVGGLQHSGGGSMGGHSPPVHDGSGGSGDASTAMGDVAQVEQRPSPAAGPAGAQEVPGEDGAEVQAAFMDTEQEQEQQEGDHGSGGHQQHQSHHNHPPDDHENPSALQQPASPDIIPPPDTELVPPSAADAEVPDAAAVAEPAPPVEEGNEAEMSESDPQDLAWQDAQSLLLSSLQPDDSWGPNLEPLQSALALLPPGARAWLVRPNRHNGQGKVVTSILPVEAGKWVQGAATRTSDGRKAWQAYYLTVTPKGEILPASHRNTLPSAPICPDASVYNQLKVAARSLHTAVASAVVSQPPVVAPADGGVQAALAALLPHVDATIWLSLGEPASAAAEGRGPPASGGAAAEPTRARGSPSPRPRSNAPRPSFGAGPTALNGAPVNHLIIKPLSSTSTSESGTGGTAPAVEGELYEAIQQAVAGAPPGFIPVFLRADRSNEIKAGIIPTQTGELFYKGYQCCVRLDRGILKRDARLLFIRTSENGTYTIRRRKEEVAGQLAPDQPEPLVDKKVRDMAKAVHTLLMQAIVDGRAPASLGITDKDMEAAKQWISLGVKIVKGKATPSSAPAASAPAPSTGGATPAPSGQVSAGGNGPSSLASAGTGADSKRLRIPSKRLYSQIVEGSYEEESLLKRRPLAGNGKRPAATHSAAAPEPRLHKDGIGSHEQAMSVEPPGPPRPGSASIGGDPPGRTAGPQAEQYTAAEMQYNEAVIPEDEHGTIAWVDSDHVLLVSPHTAPITQGATLQSSLEVVAWLQDVIAAIRGELPQFCAWLIRSKDGQEPCMVAVPRADPTLESTIADTAYLVLVGEDGAQGLDVAPDQFHLRMTPAGFRLDREQQAVPLTTNSLQPVVSPKALVMTAAVATIVSRVHQSGSQLEEGSLEAQLCGVMSGEEAELWLQYLGTHAPQRYAQAWPGALGSEAAAEEEGAGQPAPSAAPLPFPAPHAALAAQGSHEAGRPPARSTGALHEVMEVDLTGDDQVMEEPGAGYPAVDGSSFPDPAPLQPPALPFPSIIPTHFKQPGQVQGSAAAAGRGSQMGGKAMNSVYTGSGAGGTGSVSAAVPQVAAVQATAGGSARHSAGAKKVLQPIVAGTPKPVKNHQVLVAMGRGLELAPEANINSGYESGRPSALGAQLLVLLQRHLPGQHALLVLRHMRRTSTSPTTMSLGARISVIAQGDLLIDEGPGCCVAAATTRMHSNKAVAEMHYVRRAPSDQLVFTDRVKGTVQAGSSATDLQQQLVAYHIDPAVYHAARQVAMEAHTVLAKMVLRHHASPQPGAVKDRLQAAVLEAIPLEEARAWLQVARITSSSTPSAGPQAGPSSPQDQLLQDGAEGAAEDEEQQQGMDHDQQQQLAAAHAGTHLLQGDEEGVQAISQGQQQPLPGHSPAAPVPTVLYPQTLSEVASELAKPQGAAVIDLQSCCLRGGLAPCTIIISRSLTLQNGDIHLPPGCSVMIKTAEVTLQNVHLQGSLAPSGVLVDITQHSSAILQGCTVIVEAQASAALNGSSRGDAMQQEGAAIRVCSWSALHADNCAIQAHHAHGVLACDGGILEADKCTLTDCSGAGILCDDAVAMLKHCRLSNCSQGFVCSNTGVVDAFKCTATAPTAPLAVLPEQLTCSIIGDGASSQGGGGQQSGRDAQAQITHKQAEQRVNEELNRRLREQLKQEQSRSKKYRARAEQAEKRSAQLADRVTELEQQLALFVTLVPPEAAAAGAEGEQALDAAMDPSHNDQAAPGYAHAATQGHAGLVLPFPVPSPRPAVHTPKVPSHIVAPLQPSGASQQPAGQGADTSRQPQAGAGRSMSAQLQGAPQMPIPSLVHTPPVSASRAPDSASRQPSGPITQQQHPASVASAASSLVDKVTAIESVLQGWQQELLQLKQQVLSDSGMELEPRRATHHHRHQYAGHQDCQGCPDAAPDQVLQQGDDDEQLPGPNASSYRAGVPDPARQVPAARLPSLNALPPLAATTINTNTTFKPASSPVRALSPGAALLKRTSGSVPGSKHAAASLARARSLAWQRSGHSSGSGGAIAKAAAPRADASATLPFPSWGTSSPHEPGAAGEEEEQGLGQEEAPAVGEDYPGAEGGGGAHQEGDGEEGDDDDEAALALMQLVGEGPAYSGAALQHARREEDMVLIMRPVGPILYGGAGGYCRGYNGSKINRFILPRALAEKLGLASGHGYNVFICRDYDLDRREQVAASEQELVLEAVEDGFMLRWPALGKELKKERELVPHVAYHWEAVGNNLYATMRPKTE